MIDPACVHDAVVVGCGPAGAHCAQRLRRSGIDVLVFDPEPGGWPQRLDLPDESSGRLARAVLLEACAEEMDRAIRSRVLSVRPGCGVSPWVVEHQSGVVGARSVVVATGLLPRSGGIKESARVVVGPLARSATLSYGGRRVALVGGGDNAYEFALIARSAGAREAVIFERTCRASAEFQRRVAQESGVSRKKVGGIPSIVDSGDAVLVNGEPFDLCLVLIGFEANTPFLKKAHASRSGLFWAGDLEPQLLPRFHLAVRSGINAPARVIRFLRGGN